jgi:membrane-associated protease RseP (regulator of RpoE activity)
MDAVPRERYWIPVSLFLLTAFTTTVAGARLAGEFARNVPPFTDHSFGIYWEMLIHPSRLMAGLPFSLPLLAILMAHEMGHYVACQYYRIDATPPYFLPAPTLIGTFGAFIRLRSPICTRRALFDVGVAGPIAGFLFLLPAIAIGVAYSKVLPGIAERGELAFGVPLIERGLQALLFPGVASADIYLHPVGRAAWVGALATALNLLPIGQLDGGHILYAFFGEASRVIYRVFLVLLIPLGLAYSYSWLAWAALLGLFALKHPQIYDASPVGEGRTALGVLSLVIFVICFTAAPIRLL